MLNGVVSTAEGAAPSPTVFPDLNALLGELVARVEQILGDNFVGAYVVGSFALGGGDLQSDSDFLVITQRQVTAKQVEELRKLHDEIPTRDGHWPHDLEGSYAPIADLATLAALDKRWLYVNRGWRQMQWSTHCNTADVRWTLRERGITLAGPRPSQLVAEVPAEALRSSMRPLIESFLPDLLTWASFDVLWTQRYAVATLCRMLYTLDTGEVGSKQASLEWAKDALDSAWRDLIQQVIDDWALPWNDPPRPGSVEAAIAFSEYAKKHRSQIGAD
jgi:predicted nucleotidyltransferase